MGHPFVCFVTILSYQPRPVHKNVSTTFVGINQTGTYGHMLSRGTPFYTLVKENACVWVMLSLGLNYNRPRLSREICLDGLYKFQWLRAIKHTRDGCARITDWS